MSEQVSLLSFHAKEAAELFQVDIDFLTSGPLHHGLGDGILSFLCCDIMTERGVQNTGYHKARYVCNPVLSQYLKRHFSVVGEYSTHSYGDLYEHCLAIVYLTGHVDPPGATSPSSPSSSVVVQRTAPSVTSDRSIAHSCENPKHRSYDRILQCRALVEKLMQWVDLNIPLNWVVSDDESTLPMELLAKTEFKRVYGASGIASSNVLLPEQVEAALQTELCEAWRCEGAKSLVADSRVAMSLDNSFVPEAAHELPVTTATYATRSGSFVSIDYFPCCGQRVILHPDTKQRLSRAKCCLLGTPRDEIVRHRGVLFFPRTTRTAAARCEAVAIWNCCKQQSIATCPSGGLLMFSINEHPCVSEGKRGRDVAAAMFDFS